MFLERGGVIAQLECGGRLGGKAVETAQKDSSKKLYRVQEWRDGVTGWRRMQVPRRIFLFSFVQVLLTQVC